MLEYEIEAFGRRMGLGSLSLNDRGMAQLDIRGLGSFFLETRDGPGVRWLLMYLCSPADGHDPARAGRLLRMCDYRRNLPFPLAAGLDKGKSILLSRMEERRVTASAIENTLRFLAQCSGSK
ncbi:MAG: type III secretion chaperone SycN [Mailhella sp.]|nr:type III secretion chaperone SycN [Mailhella sp.]